MFAVSGFSDDAELIEDKKLRTVNTTFDSFARGMGWQGAVIAGVKNAVLEFIKQNEKGYGSDYSEVAEKLLNISPVVGSKFSKLDGAGNTYKYNKEEILEKGLSLDNTKGMEATAQVVEAITNVPIHRMIKKSNNIEGALNEQNAEWQRLLMILGWSSWDVGVGTNKKKKEDKKKEKKKKREKFY